MDFKEHFVHPENEGVNYEDDNIDAHDFLKFISLNKCDIETFEASTTRLLIRQAKMLDYILKSLPKSMSRESLLSILNQHLSINLKQRDSTTLWTSFCFNNLNPIFSHIESSNNTAIFGQGLDYISDQMILPPNEIDKNLTLIKTIGLRVQCKSHKLYSNKYNPIIIKLR